MNNSRAYTFVETALASRESAAKLRREIEAALADEGAFTLDFSKVEIVSESYADELLGVLVASRSLPWVFERLDVRGVNPDVSNTLVAVLRRRLSSTFETALKSAKEAVTRHRIVVSA